jgi:hypothetical protein
MILCGFELGSFAMNMKKEECGDFFSFLLDII